MSDLLPDPRVRRFVVPTRIVLTTGAAEGVRHAQALLTPRAVPTLEVPGPHCRLEYRSDSAEGPPGILVDFGREIHGGVQIVTGAGGGGGAVRARVRFGESVGEAMGDPNNDHALHDFRLELPPLGTHEIGQTGFRFVRIDLLEPGTWIEIRGLRAVLLWRELEYRGSFRCSDELLNRIWQTGAYTVQLCMQDFLWDGIKRDRLVWAGDLHPMAQVISMVFGKHEIVEKSLDLVRDATPLPGWMNNISAYSLWWIITHHDWYRFHGDVEYLDTQRWYLLELLSTLAEKVDADGREMLDGFRFLDWPSSGDEAAIHAGLQALLTMALRDGARLCTVLGERSGRDKCSAVREKCMEAVRRLESHTPSPGPSKQAAALMVLAGLADAHELNQAVLARDPVRGLSSFYGYYVLQARARAESIQGCLDVIRAHWGAMLSRGATTFWEDFSIDWLEGSGRIDEPTPPGLKDLHADFGAHCYKGLRHSLCHGWSAGPTAWLSEHILGLSPRTSTAGAIRIRPHLGDLEFASGTIPTPAGPVRVHHTRGIGGVIKSEVEVPEGVKVMR
jgi:alpha-L-rhamnosidase